VLAKGWSAAASCAAAGAAAISAAVIVVERARASLYVVFIENLPTDVRRIMRPPEPGNRNAAARCARDSSGRPKSQPATHRDARQTHISPIEKSRHIMSKCYDLVYGNCDQVTTLKSGLRHERKTRFAG